MSRSNSHFSTSKSSSYNTSYNNRTDSSQRQVTVLEDYSSDDDYVSTVEDNSHVTTGSRSQRYVPGMIMNETVASTSRASSTRSYLISEADVSRCFTERSDGRVYQKKAEVGKVNLMIESPELTPLLLRVAPVQKGRLVKLVGVRLTTPVEVVHLVQAKKHLAMMQITPSLEAPRFCYETVPSFLPQTADVQFILKGKEEKVKAIVLPPKQKIKTGVLPRKTSTPVLLLPPEGPIEAEVRQPLWDTVTFTISYGKHVAVEYSIPQVPVRKVRVYKAEKFPIKKVNAAILYRKTKMEEVVVEKAAKVNHLKLSTVEKEDPQLVRIVRLEQNNAFPGERRVDTELEYTLTSERRTTSTTVTETIRPRRNK